jgi:hypothetical protein
MTRFTALIVGFVVLATPAAAQDRGHQDKDKPGKPKEHESRPQVTFEAALGATREVLVAKGFEVVRVEVQGQDRIVYYRAGNQGRGRGQGPPRRLIIRRVEERLVLVDAPDPIRVEIGIKLGIRL